MMESTKGIGLMDIKGSTKYFFLFESWFFSKNLAEDAMDVGSDLNDMVTTNTKVF